MNTLTDLKRLLDEGETLVNDFGSLMWKAAQPDMYFVNHAMFSWEDIVLYSNPSLWHQRDQIGAEKPVSEPPLKGPDVLMEQVMEAYSAPYKPEKPVMMAVPVEQWDALQEELAELRRFKKRIETDPYLMLQRNMTEEQRQRANQGINQKQNK